MSKSSSKNGGDEQKKRVDSVRKRKGSEQQAVQKYMPIAEIHNDCVFLKSGGMRAVLEVTSMNFSLKSEKEQEAIIISYQQFLNTLTFPVQILVRSVKLNVDAYVQRTREFAEKKSNPLLKEQTLDYAMFIQRLVDVSEIMQKHFYIVVPADPSSGGKPSFFSQYMSWLSPGDTKDKAGKRRSKFEDMSKQLRDRVNIVTTGLEGMGLTSDRMNTSQLIEFYYQVYNPTTSQNQKINGNITGLNLTNEVI